MSNTGIILKIKKDMIIVMTSENDFMAIKVKDGVAVGQQIYFDNIDIINVNKNI